MEVRSNRLLCCASDLSKNIRHNPVMKICPNGPQREDVKTAAKIDYIHCSSNTVQHPINQQFHSLVGRGENEARTKLQKKHWLGMAVIMCLKLLFVPLVLRPTAIKKNENHQTAANFSILFATMVVSRSHHPFIATHGPICLGRNFAYVDIIIWHGHSTPRNW